MQTMISIKKLLVFYAPIIFVALAISSCGVQKVTSTVEMPLKKGVVTLKRDHPLDIAVIPFEFNENKSKEGSNSYISSSAQNAEGLFLANQLTSTIQKTSAWGAVRSIPDRKTIVDVYVDGKIINSDGEKLTLKIIVTDAANKNWYTKTYTQTVGYYAYKKNMEIYRDPFQNLFNNIANDLLEHNRKLPFGEAEKLSTISTLKFAEDFSPESFDGHIKETKSGELEISRLPAENDPILKRISSLRKRDHLFIDAMQGHYDNFTKRMHRPYQSWRQATHEEISSARELKRQSLARTVGGIAAVIGGIMASGSSNGSAQSAGAVAIGTGALLVKSGMEKRAELKIHEDVLAELEQSLESEIEPRIIELENDRVVLTGNVTEHYNQWKSFLLRRYKAEHGET